MKPWALILSLLAGGCWCDAAELALPLTSGLAGSSLSADVTFRAVGAQVTGVQFDVSYPSQLTLSAAAGAAAAAAGKTLSSADLSAGKKRFIVSGFNQTSIGDGALVALTITIQAGAAAAVYPLTVSNALAVNKDGNVVSLTTTDGNVTVGTPSSLPTAGAFTHIASGGGWKISYTLINLATTPSAVRLRFWGDSGIALSLPVTSSQTPGQAAVTTSFGDWTIPASGSLVVESEASPTGPIMTGWTELLTAGDVFGHCVFRQRLTDGKDAEAVVPFENRNRPGYLISFDETTGFLTGVALANLSPGSSATITTIVRDASGNQIATDSAPLPPGGHTQYVASERLSGLAGKRGTMEFRGASGNIAVLGLRFNLNGSFTTIPVVPK